MKSSLEIICLESPAFYALVEEVVDRLKKDEGSEQDKWIGTEEAMSMLRITSKTTLQKLRDEGRIRYSKATAKNILYDRESIMSFLDRKAEDTF